MKKKVLHLSVSKQWFDMIASGEKKEEYREIKEYWTRRLISSDPYTINRFEHYALNSRIIPPESWRRILLNPHCSFTHVLFVNGYGDDKPRVEKEIESITIGKPRKGWCPDEFLDKQYFVIKLK